jgi:hypothetical protein
VGRVPTHARGALPALPPASDVLRQRTPSALPWGQSCSSYNYTGRPSRRRCGRGGPSPGADVGGVGPVPAQMWAGWAEHWCSS